MQGNFKGAWGAVVSGGSGGRLSAGTPGGKGGNRQRSGSGYNRQSRSGLPIPDRLLTTTQT